jgi:hypothetical protein
MNQKAAISATAFMIGLFLLVGTLQGTSQATGLPTFNSPLSVTPIPRQGVGSVLFPGNQLTLTKLGSWVERWGPYPGTYPTNFQLVPMLVKDRTLPTTATVQMIAAKKGHEYWLVFNECENVAECWESPSGQAQFYHDRILPLIAAGDPNAKLIIGGSSAHECGLNWMTKFVQAYHSSYNQDPPRAGWHFHIYPDVWPHDPSTGKAWVPGEPCLDGWSGGAASGPISITDYIAQANAVRRWWSLYGSPNDEIWVTETGCLDFTFCPLNSDPSYLNDITYYLNHDGRWIDRYAWYTDFDNNYYYQSSWLVSNNAGSQLTSLGNAYSQVVVAPHVPGFQYLRFLPIVLNNYGSGSQMMMSPSSSLSPFISPLPLPRNSTFASPLKTP